VSIEREPSWPVDGATLQVEVATRPGGYTLRLVGELDCAGVGQVLDSLAACTIDGRLSVVLDLAEVTFCDAAGLSAIVTAERSVTAAAGHLSVRGASAPVLRLLALTGLDGALDLE
jgi:anti-sigma B factor antagonist